MPSLALFFAGLAVGLLLRELLLQADRSAKARERGKKPPFTTTEGN